MLKRVTDKIRSGRRPLIMGLRNGLKLWSFGRNLKQFWEFNFWGGTSEKGSTRNRTENRVTRYIKMFGGISGGLR
jgi:hypothetical protein